MSLTLDEIEAQLRAALSGSRLTIPHGLAAGMQISTLPSWMLPSAEIVLEGAEILRKADLHVQARGRYAHAKLGTAIVTVDVTQSQGEGVGAEVGVELAAPLRFQDFLAAAGITASVAVAKIAAALTVLEFASELVGSTRQVTFRLADALKFKVGPIEGRISLDQLILALDPFGWREATGTLLLSGLELPVRLPAAGEFSLEVTAPDLSLQDLIAAMDVALPPLPSVPLLTKPVTGFSLNFIAGGVRVAGNVSIAPLGKIRFAIAPVGGSYHAVAALDPLADLSFSALVPALKPLDQLLSIVSFGRPAFILSSVTAPSFALPDTNGEPAGIPVSKGAIFNGDINLKGYGLDVLEGLLGVTKLPFAVPAEIDVASVRLTATLDQKVTLLGILTTERLKVTIMPQSAVVSVDGDVTLSLGGMTLPKLHLGMTLGTGVPSLHLETREPWKKPLGLPIIIEELGVQITVGPTTEYGVFGTLTLKQRKAAVAMKFLAGEVPTAFRAELQGDFELSELLGELLGIPKLPLPTGMKIEDAIVHIVLEPQGTTIAGRRYPQGVVLAGTVTFLDFGGRITAQGSMTRAQAEGELTGPIRIQPVLEFTSSGGSGPPTFAIDSQGDPIMELNGRVTLLGIVQDVKGRVGSESIQFELQQQVGPIAMNLVGALGNGALKAEGDGSFGLKGSIGPVRLYPGGQNLGKIKLDTGCTAVAVVTAKEQGNVEMVVSATFKLLGLKLSVPQFKMSTPEFERIPQEVLERVEKNAAAIFSELLKVDKWLEAVAQGVIDGFEDAAAILKDFFNQGADAIAKGLRQINCTVEEVVVALDRLKYAPEEIVRAIGSLGTEAGDLTNEVTRVLINTLNKPAETVAAAWKAINKPPEAVKNALESAGVPVGAVEKAITNAFPDVTISGGFLKIGKPPVVTVGKPFVKLHTKRIHLKRIL